MVYDRAKGDLKNAMMTEEGVVAKVWELMETLDHIKRYNALARALKRFVLIIISSVVIFLGLGILFAILGVPETLTGPLVIAVGFVLLSIPVIGLVSGVLYVKRRIKEAKTGGWKKDLSQDFPSALKVLMELDWDETLEEIAWGKLSYGLYGLLKTGMYWFVTFFALNIIINASTWYFLQAPIGGGVGLGVVALLIVLFFLGKDLLRRYKELQSLDMLLWELRWFSFELRRAEFQT